jgi:hypothetical protein
MATTQPLSRLAQKPCTGCRARKVKCDKAHPCSQCIRFNKSCIYEDAPRNPPAPSLAPSPAPTPPSSQPQTQNDELAARVAKLESLLRTQHSPSITSQAHTHDPAAESQGCQAFGISDAIHAALTLQASPRGRLVREGERSRFVDGTWFGSLFEEVKFTLSPLLNLPFLGFHLCVSVMPPQLRCGTVLEFMVFLRF